MSYRVIIKETKAPFTYTDKKGKERTETIFNYSAIEAPEETKEAVFVLKEITNPISWRVKSLHRMRFDDNIDESEKIVAFLESMIESVENNTDKFYSPLILDALFNFYVEKLEIANKEFFRS